MNIENKVDDLARDLLYEVASEVEDRNYFEIQSKLYNYDCRSINNREARVVAHNIVLRAVYLLDKELEKTVILKEIPK